MLPSAIRKQKSFNLVPAISLGLIFVAWVEVSTAQDDSCSSLGQTLIAESSTTKNLMSPNYPSDYESNTNCSWTIETRQLSDYVVEVAFDDFRLESDNLQGCSSDYLAVYDGLPQSGSDVIGTFCGFIGPDSKVFSTGRHLTLRFVTNTLFNYGGFKLSYFAVPAVRDKKKCSLGNIDNNNLQLEGWSGTFESPRYPQKYPNFMNCLWVITVHEGKRMRLNFQHFHVQWSEKCHKDYVKVYDGLHPTSILKKTLCGSSSKLREDIYSSGRYLIVQFHSDGDNDDNYGFKAHFEEVNPNTKIIGFAAGATVVFFLCFVITCVVIHCRKAKRARHQASSESVSSSTALTPSQDPYPPPPEGYFQPTATLDYSTSPTDDTTYISDPPPPYSYPAESPPPYPGEERAPPYTPQENVYQWQEEPQENYPLVSAQEELL